MARRLLALALLAVTAGSVRGEELRNWFGDPFFQVRAAVPNCPVPRGPLMTEDDMRRSAHARAERGTRCWQEGKCAKPNAYMYDAGMAEDVRRRFAASRDLNKSSLWVTVQRRIVFVEGCAAQSNAAKVVEALLTGTPDVEQIVVSLAQHASDRVPYATLEAR